MTDGPVVITGGDRPLGRAVVEAVTPLSVPLVVGGADGEALDDLVASISSDAAVEAVRTDVRDEYDVERLIETASRQGDGPLGAVVPCARIRHAAVDEPILETPYAAFDDEVRTNLRGVYATIREAAAHCGDGTLIVVPVGDGTSEATTYAASERAIDRLAGAIDETTDLAIETVSVTPDGADTVSDASAVAGRLTAGEGEDAP